MYRRTHHQIEPHLSGLYGYAFSLTRNEDEARDLVQETALKALGAKNVPEDSYAYRVWLFRILRNSRVDRFRRNRTVQTEIDELDMKSAGEYWCHEEEHVNALTVKLSFDKLSNGQREIISLIDIVGMSYIEVGSVLGIAPGTVKSRLSRARQALMNQVSKQSSVRIMLKAGQPGE